MEQKAQTSVEYILLIGSVLMLVVLVFTIVRSRIFNGVGPALDDASKKIADYKRSWLG